MRVNPITNQQNSFQAVNQKYFKWAQREAKGIKRYGEILEQLRYEVAWGDIHPQDGIDTVEAIIKLKGGTNDFFEHVLDGFRWRLDKLKNKK